MLVLHLIGFLSSFSRADCHESFESTQNDVPVPYDTNSIARSPIIPFLASSLFSLSVFEFYLRIPAAVIEMVIIVLWEHVPLSFVIFEYVKISVSESHPVLCEVRAEAEETVAHRLFSVRYELKLKKQFSRVTGPWLVWIECMFCKHGLLCYNEIFIIKELFLVVIPFFEVTRIIT